MKQILIATHGKMASGIRYTAELIVGKMAELTTIDAYVTPEDNVEKKFEEYFAQHENDRIFVFTDLMGGSVNQKLAVEILMERINGVEKERENEIELPVTLIPRKSVQPQDEN